MLAGFWTYLGRNKYLTRNQRDFFSAKRVPCPSVPEPTSDAITAEDVERLVAVCDGPLERCWRDRAIILLLEQTGMRVSELCGMRDGQMNLAGQKARIIGKGNKPRWIFWGETAAQALGQYLQYRRHAEGDFCFRGMSSRSYGQFCSSAVRDMVKDRAVQAGVTLPAGAPCHCFRHGFARRSLENGMDGLDLQDALGYATQTMTHRYTKEAHAGRLERAHRRVWGGSSAATGT